MGMEAIEYRRPRWAVLAWGVRSEGWELQSVPYVKLSNGLLIANFSSPHPFNFTTGEVLDACTDERAKALMLESEEIETSNGGLCCYCGGKEDPANPGLSLDDDGVVGGQSHCGDLHQWGPRWTDLKLGFSMSADVMSALEGLCKLGADVVLVPFPVLQCIREIASKSADGWSLVASKCRTIRSADRVKKTIYPDRFCK